MLDLGCVAIKVLPHREPTLSRNNHDVISYYSRFYDTTSGPTTMPGAYCKFMFLAGTVARQKSIVSRDIFRNIS